MAFKRRSAEQIFNEMLSWTRGVATNLNDFRVGSKIRTLYEAVAIVIEGLFNKTFESIRKAIENNIYTALNFGRLQAEYANGEVTFSRSTPAEQNYVIPAGTILQTEAKDGIAPVRFRTVSDAMIAIGETSVKVRVVCTVPGRIGQVRANSITQFVTKPAGIDNVTNENDIINGREAETLEEQKARFNRFIESLMRGPLASIEYGATTVSIKDPTGTVIERVYSARAFEDLPNRKAEVDLYIWNGVGEASEALINEVQKVITGYYDENGNAVMGYKGAGVVVYVYSAEVVEITIRLEIIAEDWTTTESLKPAIEDAIQGYFQELGLGQSLIHSDLLLEIKSIDGVRDVVLEVSTNGGQSYEKENVDIDAMEVLVLKKPIVYV